MASPESAILGDVACHPPSGRLARSIEKPGLFSFSMEFCVFFIFRFYVTAQSVGLCFPEGHTGLCD
jgi:hypothetical protein